MKKNELILEPSTNSHVMKGNIEKVEYLEQLGGIVINLENKSILLHGEHNMICTEEKNVIKLVQQEFNPITQLLENSYD